MGFSAGSEADYINRLIQQGLITAIGGSVGFGVGTDEAALLARSAAFMPSGWAYRFDDFIKASLGSDWNVNGTWASSAAKGPGVWSALSNATTVIQQSASVTPLVANPSVTPWHIGGRMQLVVAVAAGDIKGFALSTLTPATNSVAVGIRQTVSGTKFVFAAIKAGAVVTALSTVSIDTNFHKMEIWFDGVSMWGSVDGESPVLVTTAANLPIVGLMERHGAEAASGAAADQFFDYAYSAAGRTAA